MDPEADGAVFACIEKTTEAGPTETRAWCLQERMLSARLVVFGPEQLVFSCVTGLITEQSGHCPQTLLHGPNAPLLSYKGLGAKAFDPEIRSLVLTSWYYAVSNYSTRQMSNPLDVFAAISGVARRAEQFRLGQYLAGLWSDDLLQGLLWLPKSSRMMWQVGASKRPTIATAYGDQVVTRAPSWSWAALQGPVFYGSADGEYFFSDKSRHRISPVHADPERWTLNERVGTSQLLMPECKLEFRAVLKQVRCSAVPAGIHLSRARCYLKNFGTDRILLLTPTADMYPGKIVAAGILDLEERHTGNLYCMQVVDTTWHKDQKQAEPFRVAMDVDRERFPLMVDGLLLTEQASSQGYVRVGSFKVLNHEYFDDRSGERVIELV
ncbi:hypothetical protein CKM354_001115400 [Cercospora kikuchii]|uniref:Heterokaryon incompatibility protein n=1 Tax=Cercospora kikuchii TaxID=84275 RepID=A0A9P3CSF5_9PEZI|nr:uncharacterized protein CKM354_001115400 [Cercospora kikuchii]GIZ48079.1 hypothetical protein CKM354_001115400 [Cercospora kikuchii]